MTTDHDPSAPRPWWALSVAVVALLGAVALVVTDDRSLTSDDPTSSQAHMVQVAPAGRVQLAALPHEHRTLYEAAAADPEAFSEVRCYCGCESFLDHRHLLDCFVRADGAWERHATGCAVCLSQAEELVDLREADVPLDEIVRRIDDRYGAITIDG